ncbi:unnamed protein product [Closterium sp. NIES-54]
MSEVHWYSPIDPREGLHACSMSLLSLRRSPAPPCLPCVEGRQRAAPHSSEFPPTTAPLQILHMDMWGPALVGGTDQERYFLLLRERFSQDFPVQRLHSNRGSEVSSGLLEEFCRDEGIRQTFTLPASPQQNGIAERRIGLIMEVARTSMIHAVAPHFLWPFAVRYAAHQLNLWPRVSEPETLPTLRWTGKVGDASVFRVWDALSLVRDAKVSKLSSRTLRCVFLGFPTDAPPWQLYHSRECRIFSSQDVTFDESVRFYRLHPHASHPIPLAPLFQVDPLPPQGPAPSGVVVRRLRRFCRLRLLVPPRGSHLSPLTGGTAVAAPVGGVDPVSSDFSRGFRVGSPYPDGLWIPLAPLFLVDPSPLVEPLEISSDSSGPAEGDDPAADDTAATRHSPRLETPPGFPPRPSSPPPQPAVVDFGAETAGAEPRGIEIEGEGSGGAAPGGAATRGAASPSGGGAVGDLAGGRGAGQPPQPDLLETLSLQAIRAWIVQRGSPGGGGYGPAGAGVASPGHAGGAVGTAGGTRGVAGAGGTGAASRGGTGGAAGAGGAGATSLGGAIGAGGAGPTSRGGSAGTGGAGAAGARGTGGDGAAEAGDAAGAGGSGGTKATGTRGAGASGAGAARAAGPKGARTRGTGVAGAGGAARAGGAGATCAGGAGVGGSGGVGAARPGGARTRGAGAARVGGGAGAGGAGGATRGGNADARGAGGTGVGGTGGVGAAGPGGARTRGAGAAGAGGAASAGGAGAADQSQPQLLPGSPLPAPASHTEVTKSLTERREPETRASTPVRARCVTRPCPPAIKGTHGMALRPSSVLLRVVLPEPHTSSLPHVPDPESELARAASPVVTRLLTTAITDPDFESTAAFSLVTELVNFAPRSHLDYVASLVTESESVCPPSVGGEPALSNDVLEDRHFELECLTSALTRFASMLLCPEGDSDALDIPTPRSYPEAIASEYSSHWQTAMDTEMASWKSTGTYIDEVPPPRANTVDGMWIFRVKRPPGSPPAFKARYVARGSGQRQGVDFFQTFSPTPKMTTLRPSRGDLAAPPTWLLWVVSCGTTLAALGFAPSSTDPSLVVRTDTTLPPFYVLVYVDDLDFSIADNEALALVKEHLQERHTCTDMGELCSYLGLHITQDRARCTITLTHSHMVHQVLPVLLATAHSSVYQPLALSSTFGRYIGHGARAWRTGFNGTHRTLRRFLVLYVDNKAMLALCREQRLEHRTKNIALCYFLVHELQQRRQLRLSYVALRATADVLTKALGFGDHQRFCTALGLVPTLPHLLVA